MSFLHDYLSVQFDPAHLLSETGFELAQFAVLYCVVKAKIIPRMHRKFDIEHDIKHDDAPDPFKYEVGEVVNVYAIQGFTALASATIMERKIGVFGRRVYRVRMGRQQRWQGERGIFLIDNARYINTDVYRGDANAALSNDFITR